MFGVLQFTNGRDVKKKFDNVYFEIQKMYFAFLLFYFAKCVNSSLSPMGFRKTLNSGLLDLSGTAFQFI